MAYSPEYLAHRRRGRIRRRRIIAAATLSVLLVAGGVTTFLLTRHHRVVVVRVAKVHNTPGPSVKGEYHAAPGAQSLKSVEAELNAAKHTQTPRTSGSASTGGGILATGAESSFKQLAASVPGHLELAVQPLGSGTAEQLGGDEPAHGWSTTKVPVLVALLKARGAAGLTSQEQSWAQSAITESDNASVLSLFGDLQRLKGGLGGASGYIESVLRDAGDGETSVATAPPPAGAVTTFGQTEWSPAESVKFFRALALGCLLPSSETSYVIGLMQQIESSESWGLGSAGFSSVAFKGGWGPEEGGYLVRQAGIIDPGSPAAVAVAIVNRAPDFATGTETLTKTAEWLSHHLNLTARPAAGCSSE
jgi:hypothetical protein